MGQNKDVPMNNAPDKDQGGGRASDTSRTGNYADTQGHHGDPLRDKITSEGE